MGAQPLTATTTPKMKIGHARPSLHSAHRELGRGGTLRFHHQVVDLECSDVAEWRDPRALNQQGIGLGHG